jgi:hypothetical protein
VRRLESGIGSGTYCSLAPLLYTPCVMYYYPCPGNGATKLIEGDSQRCSNGRIYHRHYYQFVSSIKPPRPAYPLSFVAFSSSVISSKIHGLTYSSQSCFPARRSATRGLQRTTRVQGQTCRQGTHHQLWMGQKWKEPTTHLAVQVWCYGCVQQQYLPPRPSRGILRRGYTVNHTPP